MKVRHPLKRREFLMTAGRAFGLAALAGQVPFVTPHAADVARQPAKPNPQHLQRLLGEMETKGPRYWSVPRPDGEFLHLLVKATQARNVLEVGTSHGYSAIWIGLGLEETGGRLTTLEMDPERYNLARKNVNEAGLSMRGTCLKGDAHREIPNLQGPFDFVFLDADKEGQMDYFRQLYPRKLLPGGILSVHNAIRQAYAMRDYLDMIRKHPDFDTVILSATLDDGFCVSYRRRAAAQG